MKKQYQRILTEVIQVRQPLECQNAYTWILNVSSNFVEEHQKTDNVLSHAESPNHIPTTRYNYLPWILLTYMYVYMSSIKILISVNSNQCLSSKHCLQ